MHTRTLLLCAVILWAVSAQTRNVGPAPDRYEAWATYPTLQECLQDRPNWKLPGRATRGVCLPETINPNQR